MKVDQFLSELGIRLAFLEPFDNIQLDSGIEKAYKTLHSVHDACSHVSDGVIEAGRHRARIMINVIEERYCDVLPTMTTMEQRVQNAVNIMERFLADFEVRASSIKGMPLGNLAHNFIGEGRRRVDESLEKAKEVVDEKLGKAREVVDEGLEKARKAKIQLKSKLEHAIQKAREHGHISYHDLPHAWRVNPHILKGYRFHTAKLDCLRSVLSISNETFNIWSHAIGLLIVLSIAFYFYPLSTNFSLSNKADVFVAAMFFVAACKCLVCSTVWHTMNSIAEQTLMERFACVDYVGISLLVAASIMTTEYTAFYCEPISRWTYLTATAIFGIGGAILPWHPHFNRADMSLARVGFYSALSATGFFPLCQLIWTRGYSWALYFYGPIGKSLLVYVAGATLYAAKLPERLWPGGFDYFGGSHNIWHVAVLGGILFHYHAMHHFFAEAFLRAENECFSS